MSFDPTAYPCVWKDKFYNHRVRSSDDFLDGTPPARILPALPPTKNFLQQEPLQHIDLRLREESSQAKVSRTEISRTESLPQSCRVLIVEDDKDNLFYAECAVEEFGYQWASTRLGCMALPLALAYKPDVILLDIWLKEVTGFDVLRHLQQHSQTMHIPAIAVTALSTPREVKRITEAGFANYLIKPYLLEDLGRLLASHQPSSMPPSERMDTAES